ncbi:MAG: lysylphosphatidylglycerol synthase transmembrane domain-containing protein [Candidatus Saccharibacteria bacterium]
MLKRLTSRTRRRQAQPVSPSGNRAYIRYIYLAISVIALYVIVPQLSIFQHSLGLVRGARLGYVLAALSCNLMSYQFAALTYYCLAIKPLYYRPTWLVQVASMFTNRLLPAGLGGMGANFVYLRRMRYSSVQALSMVGLNGILGFVGHSLLVGGLLVFVTDARRHVPTPHISSGVLVGAFGLLTCLAVGILAAPGLRRKLKIGLIDLRVSLMTYRRHPVRLLAALGSSMTLTVTNLLCLWLSVLAVGGNLGLVPVLLVLTFGVALGAVAPTPGGIGGFEAGLVAGFIAYRVPASQALAAVLIFRLINYWFSLLVGAMGFIAAQRRGYL